MYVASEERGKRNLTYENLKKQLIRTQNDKMAHTRFENVYGLVNKRYVIFSESYGFKATIGAQNERNYEEN